MRKLQLLRGAVCCIKLWRHLLQLLVHHRSGRDMRMQFSKMIPKFKQAAVIPPALDSQTSVERKRLTSLQHRNTTMTYWFLRKQSGTAPGSLIQLNCRLYNQVSSSWAQGLGKLTISGSLGTFRLFLYSSSAVLMIGRNRIPRTISHMTCTCMIEYILMQHRRSTTAATAIATLATLQEQLIYCRSLMHYRCISDQYLIHYPIAVHHPINDALEELPNNAIKRSRFRHSFGVGQEWVPACMNFSERRLHD
jgi:hypothetical protein